MKLLRVCALLIVATYATHSAFAAEDADRPAGVDAQHWLPISDGFGFVVVAEPKAHITPGSRQVLIADPERVSADLMPPKKGYFVIKTKAGWQRVVMADLSESAG